LANNINGQIKKICSYREHFSLIEGIILNSLRYKWIVISMLSFIFLFNIGMSFAYWASSVSGNQDTSSATLTIGT
jgi:hypothetical protein